MKNFTKYNIKTKKSILSWDEALPLGNGKIGALIYGDGPLRVSLDRVDLWDKRVNPKTLEKGFTFKNLTKLSTSDRKEDWQERARLFEDIFTEKPYPSKITAGRLELDFGEKCPIINSEVDIYSAIANVSIGDKLKIEAFTSATEHVGVMLVEGDYRLTIHLPEYLYKKEGKDGFDPDGGFGYERAEIKAENGFTYYVQNTFTDFKFGIVAYEKRVDKKTEIYFTIATTDDGENFLEDAKAELLRASEKGYGQLKTEHKKWWKKYWSKTVISLGDELIERVYYRSWYLFASCSRKGFYPMPLQGVWTADSGSIPPWKGDYHYDTNTELSYQAYLKADRLAEGRVFIDYLWNMRGQFKTFAHEFYGVDGLMIPSCATVDGKAMGGWAHYSLSPTMTVWTSQSFDEYYLYTGDKTFLKNRAYPFFREVGKAISGLLVEKDGKLYLPLSSSPEIFDDTKRAYLQPNSNFDLALLIYLYKTLVGYCEILELDASGYRQILSKLDCIAVSNDGVVMLDKTQLLPESHRHFSHVMCMYPLHLINYQSEEHKRIYDATILHLEQLGTGWWVGFSFAMSAQIYAMAKRGNSAYERLRQFALGFVADNGFHLNGDFKNFGFSQWHYRPFTLESLFGFADAVHETLLQDHMGFIDLLPAVSDLLGKISFKKMRSRNGVMVSCTGENGEVKTAELSSKRAISVKIKNNFGSNRLKVLQNSKETVVDVERGEIFTVDLLGKAVVTAI
ncbi:MAG: glycoside hydrolase N-terminal domain-containing protein [Clostridia bacterium]|nr:glycoside hydrolase N-terminal domain-containing protein [Clostridia bacterium]